MPIFESGVILANLPIVAKFILDKIMERQRKKGTEKEVEELRQILELYKSKLSITESELKNMRSVAERVNEKAQLDLSDNAYINWNLTKMKADDAAFKIEVWTGGSSSRDITVRPKTSPTYRIGENINVYFRSEKNCYMTLINFGTSGKLTVLFPNAHHTSNFILGNKVYEIPGEEYPFEYQLTGPPGTEKLKAIATTQRTNLMNLDLSKGLFHVTESTAASRDISILSKNIEEAQPTSWSESTYEFDVVD